VVSVCPSYLRHHFRVCNDHVSPSTSVRDLGIYLDSDVSMRTQVSRTVSQCFGILSLLRPVRRSVSQSVFQSLVAALVLTKLDFGNATLAGVPSVLLDRLQAVMNAAARLVFQSSLYDHVTPLLHRLHWLRTPERISYKLTVLVFQCTHGLGLVYLSDTIQPVARIPGRRRLRSSSTSANAQYTLLRDADATQLSS